MTGADVSVTAPGIPCHQVFYEEVCGCRRRGVTGWRGKPVGVVFSLRSEVHLLKQHAQVMMMMRRRRRRRRRRMMMMMMMMMMMVVVVVVVMVMVMDEEEEG
jgi:hypothetical protein